MCIVLRNQTGLELSLVVLVAIHHALKLFCIGKYASHFKTKANWFLKSEGNAKYLKTNVILNC